MRRIPIIVCSIVALVLYGAGCETPLPVPDSSVLGETASWPPADQNSQTVKLASNMLAKNYEIVLDGSGSMGESNCTDGSGTKLDVAKDAIARFLNTVSSDANVGLVAFDGWSGTSERSPLTTNRKQALDAANTVKAGGGTPLHNAITVGYEALVRQGRAQQGYGEYNLVLVTDGEASGKDPTAIVHHILTYSPVVIHTIGFCIDEHHSLNQPGKVLYKVATNPAELSRRLEDVLAEAEHFTADKF